MGLISEEAHEKIMNASEKVMELFDEEELSPIESLLVLSVAKSFIQTELTDRYQEGMNLKLFGG